MPSPEKVLILVDVAEPLPPDYDFSYELTTKDWKTESDVLRAIRQLGHECALLGVHNDLRLIHRKIEEYQPTVIFNLVEEFNRNSAFEQHITALLEMIGLPFTGCGATGITLCKHKGISKKILGYHRIHVPEFTVIPNGKPIRRPKRLRFPIFVKPLKTESSFGIAQASLVESDAQFQERVAFVHEKFSQDAIAEEYIVGRELYASLLGNQQVQSFPLRELIFGEVPEDEPKFASYMVKWNEEYRQRWGIRNEFADLEKSLAKRIEKTCRKIYQVLAIEGFARLDLRLTDQHELYFLEANPNPHLAEDEDFAQSAQRAGYSFPELIDKLIGLAKTANRA